MAYPHSPLVAFVVGIVAVVLLLAYWQIPAFIGLIIAAFTVGLIAPQVAFPNVAQRVADAFGSNMAGIGIPILMAAVIGKSMMASGAAERIVRAFTSLTGSENSDFALWGSSSMLSIPVFFDNVFYLMAPLARSMRARVGDNYSLYIVVVGAGGATTHVFVPPTPGPLAVANEIGVSLGITILVGLAVAIPTAAVAGIVYGRWLNRRLDIPLRDSMDTSGDELEELSDWSNERLPSVFEASLPILLAVALVASNTATTTFIGEGTAIENFTGSVDPTFVLAPLFETPISSVTGFVGNPNFALTVAAVAAALTFRRVRDITHNEWTEELTEALMNGGNIAAITAAGGAFGAMLAAAGVGNYIAGGLKEIGIGLVLTAWVIAALIRIAQGSATVAMLTTAGIVAPLTGRLAVHPVYLAMAIGAGGNICSWYNDSGFWLVKEIGGLTQLETLKTWTVVTTLISVVGITVVMILSTLFPLA